MSRQSAAIDTLGEVGYSDCVVCLYYNKNYLFRKIGNHWHYCEAYISKCLGDDETKKVEEERKKRAEFTKRYHKSNHGKQQRIMCGYKKAYMNSNHEPTLKYSVANVVANGWLNIEDDEHPFNWTKDKSILSTRVFNDKVQNRLIMYLQGQKRNYSSRISNMKEPWTALNLKAIKSIFHPD